MDVIVAPGEVAVHALILEPGVVSSVTFEGDVDRVEIRFDGATEIFYTRNGDTPVIAGPNSYRLPAGTPGMDAREMGGAYSTLRFISAVAATVSVQRDD